jgi:hypothetical protein
VLQPPARHPRGRISELAESSNGLRRSGLLPRHWFAEELRGTSVPHHRPLADQHAVAVTVEAVARFDGMAVGRENIFAASKSTDQRKQRRAR